MNAGTFSELPSAMCTGVGPWKSCAGFAGVNGFPLSSYVIGVSRISVFAPHPKSSNAAVYVNGFSVEPGDRPFAGAALSTFPWMSVLK